MLTAPLLSRAAVALRLLLPPGAHVGNVWWLSTDPSIANFQTGGWEVALVMLLQGGFGVLQSNCRFSNGWGTSATMTPYQPSSALYTDPPCCRLPAPHLPLLPASFPPQRLYQVMGIPGHNPSMPSECSGSR